MLYNSYKVISFPFFPWGKKINSKTSLKIAAQSHSFLRKVKPKGTSFPSIPTQGASPPMYP
jgi:hypothetical protein